MKLTKEMKSAFVRAVLDDLPSVDYVEMARKKVFADNHSRLPAPIAQIANDAALKGHLNMRSLYQPPFGSMMVFHDDAADNYEVSAQCEKELDKLAVLHREQSAQRNDLELKLEGVVNGVTTRKALVELLPEFEKYMPTDASLVKTTNLPAIANLVCEFTKAGWPKGKVAA